MYLKRLELQGFKTFAVHTELEFNPGITAIVGPNGSGKSNLFDAIRWVLGEASARTLRGTRMEDVIFAGSEHRRALGLATVSLTLDNTQGALPVDFTEVTVTRRATRGGEGEYFLNGVPCRLRDIQHLFLGTGLGGRSYALIGQGEVDAILDATPQERRFLLEEAAGLARYKRRKVEAERRLAYTAQNLLRLNDLIGELDCQLTSLTQQADVAQRYQSYTQELRDLELFLVVDEVRRLLRGLRRLTGQVEGARSQYQEMKKAEETVSQQIAALRAQAEGATRTWEEAQRELVRAVEEQASEESAVRLLEERIRLNLAQEDRLTAELQQAEGALARIEEEIRSLGEQEEELRRRKGSLEASIVAQEQAMASLLAEASTGAEQLESLRADAVELARARAQAQNERASLQATVGRILVQIEAARAQEARLAEEVEALTERRLALVREVEAAKGSLDAGEERLRQLQIREQALKGDLEAIRKQEQRLAMERQGILTRLHFLEEAQAHYSGYDRGAQEVLLARSADPARFPEVVGAVVDLVRVPPAYRKAIEAALYGRLYALVTRTWEGARETWEWLQAKGVGGTLLPLDLIPARSPVSYGFTGPGIVGMALDFAEAEEPHDAILRALLADVLITEDLETALRVHREGFPGDIVTLGGEVVASEGAVRLPGRANHEVAAIGRREEVENARRALAACEARVREVESRRRERTGELTEVEARIKEAEASVHSHRQILVERQKELALVEDQLARIPQVLEEINSTREELDKELSQLQSRTEAVEKEILGLSQELEATEESIQQIQATWKAVEEAKGEVQEQMLALKVSLAEVTSNLEGTIRRREEREEEREQMRNRSRDLLRELEEMRQNRARDEELLRETRDRLQALQVAVEATRELLQSQESERMRLSSEATALEEEWQRVQRMAREHEEAVHRLEIRQAQLEAEFQGGVRRIQDEFGMSWEEAKERLPREVDRDEALGRIESLRGLVAALGPVNLRAIEERKQVEARLRTLRTQAEDLAAGRESLLDLIGHIEAVLRVRFRDTFAAVNREFGTLFERLFDGGHAHLELVAPVPPEGQEEPAALNLQPSAQGEDGDEGVEVMVQLPGKKQRPISSLSGGERVMVALALIFAMLRVHPSPFCVFDEVDAALDEVNTEKFTDLLREMAEKTQVIVITHNKETMEASDVLYGVTMEEPGVSKLVSMRLVGSAH